MRNRTLRVGMMEGGTNACIGVAHRSAVLMDGEMDIIRGKYSHNKEWQVVAVDRLTTKQT